MEGVSLLEILIWVSHNKSGILIPFCLQAKTARHIRMLIISISTHLFIHLTTQ
jgi:hypothetical protein